MLIMSNNVKKNMKKMRGQQIMVENLEVKMQYWKLIFY